jgi:peroxiredoxin
VTRLIWSNDRSDAPEFSAEHSCYPNDADSQGLVRRAIRAAKKAPDFRLPDQHGHRVTLTSLMRRGAVVLRFCRNENTAACVHEFSALPALHNDVQRLGAGLVIIAVEPFDPRPLGRAARSFPFPILPDALGKVAQSYGLTYQASGPTSRGISSTNGNSKRGLRIMSAPATYVIDPTGLVALAFVDVECRTLMDHGQILMALECLNKRKQS